MSAPSSSSQLLALLRTRGASSISIPVLLMADRGTKILALVNWDPFPTTTVALFIFVVDIDCYTRQSAVFAEKEVTMEDHHWFYFFITFACSLLLIERIVLGVLGIKRLMERHSAREADRQYAKLRADENEWDPELFT
jgi:hypothetical protein